jgi:hypothetical protein
MRHWWVLSTLLLMPLAGAEVVIDNPWESTPTTMYMHLNGFEDMPVNTQEPSFTSGITQPLGMGPPASLCLPATNTADGFTSSSRHTWYGYSSNNYVQYEVDEGGKPRIWLDRGISFDAILDGDSTPILSWFLRGETSPGADGRAHPPIPNVIVRATVREGDAVSVGHTAFNTGNVIAIGQSQPSTLAMAASPASPHVTAHEKDDHWVYEFRFPLEYQSPVIPANESFNIRIDAFMDNEYCNDPGADGTYAMPDYVAAHASPEFLARLEWNIMNPLRIEGLAPQFLGDDLALHAAVSSAWGAYDVSGDQEDEVPLLMEISGPTAALNLELIEIVSNTNVHGYELQRKPVTGTWVWDYVAEQALDGEYQVTFMATNDQQTATATATATFTISPAGNTACYAQDGGTRCVTQGVDQEAPGIGALVGLLGIVCAGLALRRRPL